MGFNEGSIILDSTNGAYYAGQNVNGRIVFQQLKVKLIHGISVDIKGFCKVHWTSDSSRREGDRDVTYRVNHDSHEEYFSHKFYVFGDASGENHLNPGYHDFRFVFHLPINCPGSFEGSNGHVRYRIKAKMLTTGMLNSNKEKMFPIRVIAPLDLNQHPEAKHPLEMELIQSFCCWCVSSGASEIRVRAPVGGYCPGQVIPLEVSCVNNSNVDITTIEISLRRDIKYIATSERDTRTDKQTLSKVTKSGAPAGTTRDWPVNIEIPVMDIANLHGCQYIKITNYIVLKTHVRGCHKGAEEQIPIILGTVPFTGYPYSQLETPASNPQTVNVFPPLPVFNQPTTNIGNQFVNHVTKLGHVVNNLGYPQ